MLDSDVLDDWVRARLKDPRWVLFVDHPYPIPEDVADEFTDILMDHFEYGRSI